jgi:YD repeat-containing protein
MFGWSRWLRTAAGRTALFMAAALAQPAFAAAPARDFLATRPSSEARRLVEWALRTGDARGRPFAVVDKKAAHLYVFDADGRLAGHTSALLGSAIGDHTPAQVDLHAQSGHVPPEERTTPAGRFEAAPGLNASGEHVVWVDYDSAFAIHRLRPGFAYHARAARLATSRADRKRVSWGCVAVPVRFYEQVVQRVLGASRSVVYVMPETMPLARVIDAL